MKAVKLGRGLLVIANTLDIGSSIYPDKLICQYHPGKYRSSSWLSRQSAARLARTPRQLRGNAMLTVHHLNNSRSQRVLWLLEELDVPYEIVRYQRQPDMRAPKELRAVHPLGKSPVITDNGNTIAESGAICEYIIGT